VTTAVESLTYSRGYRKNEADVFDHVTTVMFTSAAGDRRNVPNYVSYALLFVSIFQKLFRIRIKQNTQRV